MRAVGIVGGLGPATTAKFYEALVKKCRQKCESYPPIIIDSISFPFTLEKEIIADFGDERRMLPYIARSILRLNKSGADFIAIPCNTIHTFMEDLREVSIVPVLSIIEETVDFIKNTGLREVGVLSTAKTSENGLYSSPLRAAGIRTILPTTAQQTCISGIIFRAVRNETVGRDVKILNDIINDMTNRGAEAVVMGCTDLQLLTNRKDGTIIDSMSVLLDAVFRKMHDETDKAFNQTWRKNNNGKNDSERC